MKVESTAYRQKSNELNSSQKELIRAKENEIKKVNNLFNAKIKQTKLEGDINLSNLQEHNKEEVSQSLANKEETLEKVNHDLAQEQVRLRNERQNLMQAHQSQISDLSLNNDESYRALYDDALNTSKNVHDQTASTIQDIQSESNQQIRNVNFNTKLNMDQMVKENEVKMRQTAVNLDQSKRERTALLMNQLEEQRKDHQNKIDSLLQKNQAEFKVREQVNASKVSHQDALYQELLRQKEETFKEKFAAQEQSHQEILKRINARFDGEAGLIVSKYADFKRNLDIKAEDDFYQVKKLDPTIIENPDHYIVSLPVPEYEKETVNLTAQERKISIVQTRKFSAKGQDLQGNTDGSGRSEVLTKTFDVQQILDPTKVTRKYEEGWLSFQIAKR